MLWGNRRAQPEFTQKPGTHFDYKKQSRTYTTSLAPMESELQKDWAHVKAKKHQLEDTLSHITYYQQQQHIESKITKPLTTWEKFGHFFRTSFSAKTGSKKHQFMSDKKNKRREKMRLREK